MKTILFFAVVTYIMCRLRQKGGCLAVGAVLLLIYSAYADAPDQAARWQRATISPRETIALDALVARWQRTESTYQAVEAMRANGVPATVAFCLFYREADSDLSCSPAQGDPLTHRSRNVPAGRIPGKTPPYKWSDAAFDAYYVVDHLDQCDWHDKQAALDKIESFNGFGYRAHGVAAPYLWSGTTVYTRGKYVRDGRFDPLAVDRQLGVAAILKRMQERGIALPF